MKLWPPGVIFHFCETTVEEFTWKSRYFHQWSYTLLEQPTCGFKQIPLGKQPHYTIGGGECLLAKGILSFLSTSIHAKRRKLVIYFFSPPRGDLLKYSDFFNSLVPGLTQGNRGWWSEWNTESRNRWRGSPSPDVQSEFKLTFNWLLGPQLTIPPNALSLNEA